MLIFTLWLLTCWAVTSGVTMSGFCATVLPHIPCPACPFIVCNVSYLCKCVTEIPSVYKCLQWLDRVADVQYIYLLLLLCEKIVPYFACLPAYLTQPCICCGRPSPDTCCWALWPFRGCYLCVNTYFIVLIIELRHSWMNKPIFHRSM